MAYKNQAITSGDYNNSTASYASNSLFDASMNISLNDASFQSNNVLVMAVVSLIVFVIGLLGNTLVIYVVLRYAKMKTVTNIYILNLAVADELYVLGLPFMTTQNVLSYWPFGSFLCRVVMTVDSINQFTSIFCLTMMSIDRYLAVVQPIRSANWRRPHVAKIINGIIWLLSIVVVLPVIIFSKVQEDFNTCNMSWPEPHELWSTAFILYTAILGFFAPLLVICLCYLLIIIKVKSAGLRAGLTTRRRSERKVTRMVVVIVLVFVLCWLPFYITNIVNLVFILPESSAMTIVYLLVIIMSYVNSCANPVLYGFLSDNFKQSFRKVLCLNRATGPEDGYPRHNPLLSLSNHSFNGHMPNSQGIQMEPCVNMKVEPPPSNSLVIGKTEL